MAIDCIENVASHEGGEVTFRGWVYNRRSSGKLQFILLRDGTGVIQCVAFRGSFTAERFEALDKLTQESSLIVRGKGPDRVREFTELSLFLELRFVEAGCEQVSGGHRRPVRPA